MNKARKIPIFYHIPKNAGTYVSDWMLIAFRYYREKFTDWLKNYTLEKDSIKVIQITRDGFIIARLLVGDPNFFCDKQLCFNKSSKVRFYIDFDKNSFDWLDEVFILGVIIEANGFKIRQDILKLVQEYELYQFLILREPFSRAQSIYKYNTSNESIHDYAHNSITSKTFEDYITSSQIEDSWLIRNLLNVGDTEGLNDKHFLKTVELLKSFNVYDIKRTDTAIQKAFAECYGFDIKQIKLNSWDIVTKNETNYKKINIEELPEQMQNTFKTRTVLDQKLYDCFSSQRDEIEIKEANNWRHK